MQPAQKHPRGPKPTTVALATMATRRQEALNAALEASGVTIAAWAREVAETARLAAATGDFGPAIKAYELLGRHLGHLSEGAPQQHLHLHGQQAPLATLTDAQLRERIVALTTPAAVEPAPITADPFA